MTVKGYCRTQAVVGRDEVQGIPRLAVFEVRAIDLPCLVHHVVRSVQVHSPWHGRAGVVGVRDRSERPRDEQPGLEVGLDEARVGLVSLLDVRHRVHSLAADSRIDRNTGGSHVRLVQGIVDDNVVQDSRMHHPLHGPGRQATLLRPERRAANDGPATSDVRLPVAVEHVRIAAQVAISAQEGSCKREFHYS